MVLKLRLWNQLVGRFLILRPISIERVLFAINTKPMRDLNYKVSFVSYPAPGSKNDSTAYAISVLSELLKR